jgi:hypothetical protein
MEDQGESSSGVENVGFWNVFMQPPSICGERMITAFLHN